MVSGVPPRLSSLDLSSWASYSTESRNAALGTQTRGMPGEIVSASAWGIRSAGTAQPIVGSVRATGPRHAYAPEPLHPSRFGVTRLCGRGRAGYSSVAQQESAGCAGADLRGWISGSTGYLRRKHRPPWACCGMDTQPPQVDRCAIVRPPYVVVAFLRAVSAVSSQRA